MIILSANPALKWMVLIVSAMCLGLSAEFVYMLVDGGNVPVLMVLIAFSLLNAIGLLRLTSWARLTSIFALWVVILSVVGRFSPTYVDHYASLGQVPPSTTYLILTTLVVAVPCLFVINLFHKYRKNFRRVWF